MTRYHACWDIDGIERGYVRTVARTLLSVDNPRTGKHEDVSRVASRPLVWLSSAGGSPAELPAESPAEPFAESRANEPQNNDALRPLREAPQPSNDATAAPTAETLDSLWPGLEPPRPAADESATRTSSHEPSRPAGEPREPPVEAPVHAPGDFSDLIALAGPAPLDEGYHDYPSALHATVGNRAGRPRGPSVLTLDHDSDPLLNLAAEYEQALLNETAGARHKLNAGAIERPPSARPPADPFEDAERAPSSQSLLDLLVVGQNVDTILDSLDSFGAERIFEDDRRQEILWLLAPQGSTVPRASRAAQLAREEHHLISVDSRIDVIATPSDEPGSHDENDH